MLSKVCHSTLISFCLLRQSSSSACHKPAAKVMGVVGAEAEETEGDSSTWWGKNWRGRANGEPSLLIATRSEIKPRWRKGLLDITSLHVLESSDATVRATVIIIHLAKKLQVMTLWNFHLSPTESYLQRSVVLQVMETIAKLSPPDTVNLGGCYKPTDHHVPLRPCYGPCCYFLPLQCHKGYCSLTGWLPPVLDSGMPTVIKDLEKTMHLMAYSGWQVLSYLGNVYEPNRCSFLFCFSWLHCLILALFCRFFETNV